jgi:hypothetical protein
MICLFCHAQELARNTIYLEAGGTGILGSLNYERLFPLKNNDYAITLRSGFTCRNFILPDHYLYGLPVGTSFVVRGRKVSFEAGPSFSVMLSGWDHSDEFPGDKSEDLLFILGLRMGVRHQPIHKGIFWNILFQPSFIASKTVHTLSYNGSNSFYFGYLPWLSLGIGYSF